MRNSAIDKSSSFITCKKLSGKKQKQPTKYKNFVLNSGQQYSQTNHSQIEQILLASIRKSSIKSIEKKNQLRQQKRIPLFFGFSNSEEQCIEPNVENSKEEKVSNDLVRTKYTSKPSLQNSINESLIHQEEKLNTHRNSLVQQQEQYPQMKQPQFYEGIMFGEGLEQIDGKNRDFAQNISIEEKPPRNSINLGEKSGQYSIATGHQNNISSKKTLYQQIRDADYRKTSKNFFKRSNNSSQSQGHFKPSYREQQKIESKGTVMNTKAFSKSSNQRESRESFFIKTQQLGRQSYNQKAMFRNSKSYLTIANNLDRLQFRYNGGHAMTLYNYKLKIKNESLVNLGVKIKCTSPKHYQVKPCYEITLQPLQIRNISIEMKLYPHDLDIITMKHDLSRYKHDKFMIMYWTADSINEFDYCEGQKILPVSIQQTQQQRLRNEGFTKSINDMKTKQEIEEKEIQMYKKLICNNNVDVRQIDAKIKKIQSKEYKNTYFTAPLFLVLSFVGVGIGFCIG